MPLATPYEIQSWLEWAGQRILIIQVGRLYPSDKQTSWPDYPQDRFTAFGYTGIKLRPQAPSKEEIPVMDEILDLVNIVPVVTQRQILNARALVYPISQRHLNSWSRIAALIDSNPSTVKQWHKKGLEYISRHVDEDRVGRFRSLLT